MRYLSAIALLAFMVFAQPAAAQEFGLRLSNAAIERTQHRVVYDPAYVRIAYPMGDVAPDRGVCSDVVVRSFRALNIDLQKLVHEDMRANFSTYPGHWGMQGPDKNIDHRRVPNLETFFSRKGAKLRASNNPLDYRPGDIVAWNLKGDSGWLPHIGIVTERIAPSGQPMVVHNIGAGPKLEDILFNWKMTGHYRFDESFLSDAT